MMTLTAAAIVSEALKAAFASVKMLILRLEI